MRLTKITALLEAKNHEGRRMYVEKEVLINLRHISNCVPCSYSSSGAGYEGVKINFTGGSSIIAKASIENIIELVNS